MAYRLAAIAIRGVVCVVELALDGIKRIRPPDACLASAEVGVFSVDDEERALRAGSEATWKAEMMM